jgi:hypothetical protein
MCDKNTEPTLTDYDITMNSLHQDNMFKGTIVVCIIYAVFAFILIAAAYFVDNIRNLLFDKFLPFTMIYIIGTIIIIMIFIYNILSFKPKKIEKKKVDENISCPDYWKLEVLDDNVIEKSFDVDNYNKNLFKYRCVMDDKVFDKLSIYKQDKKSYLESQYRMGNIPGYVTKIDSTTYTDIYPTTGDQKSKLDMLKNNNNYYLYKNINAYRSSNLNYINDKSINNNIIDDLRESALVMNNYKTDLNGDKTKITGFTDITSNVTDPTNNYRNYYYNSPDIITWSTPKSNNTSTSEYTGIPTTTKSSTYYAQYTASVYDWSVINMDTILSKYGSEKPINVYIIDFSLGTANNFVLVGTLNFNKKDNDKLLYFKPVTDIHFTGLFTSKASNHDVYFDKTYLTATIIPSSATVNAGYISDVTNNISEDGPKVRLFNISRRPFKLDDINTLNDGSTHTINFKTQNVPLTCSAVYPSFLAAKEENYTENNTLRCAYSKICNIPWSDMHCNEITDI